MLPFFSKSIFQEDELPNVTQLVSDSHHMLFSSSYTVFSVQPYCTFSTSRINFAFLASLNLNDADHCTWDVLPCLSVHQTPIHPSRLILKINFPMKFSWTPSYTVTFLVYEPRTLCTLHPVGDWYTFLKWNHRFTFSAMLRCFGVCLMHFFQEAAQSWNVSVFLPFPGKPGMLLKHLSWLTKLSIITANTGNSS